ncbi:hypothetical protein FB565_006596 [Actinoplanes lutulentus]|uniref:Serine phosphatase RsbU (Regulator of sigma subunit) n=1 Tax=Actinoplanes lutulentus TaxID=1287878 RepID=A0A327Z9G6_9ACTN|nr:PP2C family protein-serine/threonine phosphatase [Actinoplanes lutulentus]MBB2946828.1 hypothetical protein [Actinoplanes lutulentus]RAK35720.1 serine phosphatase RsbU (regulator of sigma subunit) [Actinoplanes lutulentus]
MIDLFEAAGSLRGAYADVGWAATTLGPPAAWSPTLQTAVDLALRSKYPVTLFWGDEFRLIYNEAYVPMIGDKHPSALGAPTADVFPEIWDVIGPMLESVRSSRQATMADNLLLMMDRHGFTEETYFTFCYSPIVGPSGEVEGMIDIATETTSQILAHRRLEVVARLTDALAAAGGPGNIAERALTVLRSAPADLPEVTIRLGPVVDVPGTESVRISDDPVAALDVRLSEHLHADEAYLGFVRLIGAALTQAFTRAQVRLAEQRMSEALQHSLLTAPVRAANLDIAVRYRSAAHWAQIGGDWYDSFQLPDGSLAMVVGDVTGHDRDAAAVMAQMRNLLRGVAYGQDRSPARILTALDVAMRGLGVGSFASALLVRLLPGRMWWSSAGHLPPATIQPDGRVTLLHTSPETLLGFNPATVRQDHTTELAPGTTVVLYTDGLVERRHQIIDAGLAKLVATLTDRQDLSPGEICDLLLAEHAGGDDDVALLVFRVLA